MRLTFLLPLMMAMLLMPAGPGWAQCSRERATVPAPPVPAAASANPYAGKWTYRSYLNQPDVIVDGDPQKAFDLIFGEGIMTFETPLGTTLKGTFDMGDGFVLDLTGAILGEPSTAPPVLLWDGASGHPHRWLGIRLCGLFGEYLAKWHRASPCDRWYGDTREATWSIKGRVCGVVCLRQSSYDVYGLTKGIAKKGGSHDCHQS
jgi:hypothetical protein